MRLVPSNVRDSTAGGSSFYGKAVFNVKILFIRHGSTAGNLEKRYIGRTDEPLCAEGTAQLKTLMLPSCEIVVCSPMKRCIQTAEILFPKCVYLVSEELSECDFGDFEGKNYSELSGDPYYQSWIDSGGTLPFPNGEVPSDFRRRCAAAFESIIKNFESSENVAFVVHGGTIMSILEKYSVPHRDYFDLQCKNGHGFVCEWDKKILVITEEI